MHKFRNPFLAALVGIGFNLFFLGKQVEKQFLPGSGPQQAQHQPCECEGCTGRGRRERHRHKKPVRKKKIKGGDDDPSDDTS